MKEKRIPRHSTMPFEHTTEPIASTRTYQKRIMRYFWIAFSLLTGSLFAGMLGYKYIVGVAGWDDAFLNASMILTGMGPMIDPTITLTTAAKIFSGLYAIYSGVAFLSSIALFFTPIVHRFFHLMHIDVDDN
jgi:hypothetical protein